MTYADYLREGKARLESEQAALLVMLELCQQHQIDLYQVMDETMDEVVRVDYLEAIDRMEEGEPMDYVLGSTNFYGYDLIVNQDVLIPRPETEELVSLVLSLYDDHFKDQVVDVFDVACGSGAIGLTLAKEEANMRLHLSDISEKALVVAKQNAERLGIKADFLCGDMVKPFMQANLKAHILVCNPPYIPNDEQMEASVVDFEPHIALFGGEDGLDFYRQVLSCASQVLHEQFVLAFEMGYQQGERLSQLAKETFPNARIRVHQDLAGKDRMLSIEGGFEWD